MLSAVFVPVYIGIRLTGGSTEKLQQLPDLLDRVKTPVVWEVPEGGVRYMHFFHGEPSEGHKFVLVRVRMEARMKRLICAALNKASTRTGMAICRT